MANPETKDRLKELLAAGATRNGIDFVEIASSDETTLRVHFLNSVPVQGMIADGFPTITGGETIRTVSVKAINDATDWSVDADGNQLLTLVVGAPGDFSFYTLTIKSESVDEFFDHATFSFKALCDSDLDCEPPPPECPVLPDNTPPIDYLAKDFLSFRKALSDFSALRYPEWQERSEADFGVMFMEALCSLADDLSYTQDRIAAEASLLTATQRRSIVRHARLVDYEPRPATAARVLLRFEVDATITSIPVGTRVSAQTPDAGTIQFETGTGMMDKSVYPVSDKWNSIEPYFWDDSQKCLRARSTEMWVLGHGKQFVDGQLLLIDTPAKFPADPPVREIVHLVVDLTKQYEHVDHVYGNNVTLITWRPEDALKFDHDISLDGSGKSRTMVAGNLVPASEGTRFSESFAIDAAPASTPEMPLAVVRQGPNSAPPDGIVPLYQYTLNNGPLAWLDDPEVGPLPEVFLQEGAALEEWLWYRRLLDAETFESAFTLDTARFRRIARNSDGLTFTQDYDGVEGDTIRFGDGLFGAIPDGPTFFLITYRVGGGATGNVAADTIQKLDLSVPSGILSVTNPFAAAGGADPESDERVRRLAPQEFRATQFRAVRSEDYVKAAKTLGWVSNAGTVFRWTGSWLTVFTTADPKGTEEISIANQIELINLLNRYRLAGYESYTPRPRFASLDLEIKVCAQPQAFRGDVEAAILAALGTRTFADGTGGFFSPDKFTFGSILERSSLEAAIQAAYGVAGVVCIMYRQRGVHPAYVVMPETVRVASDQILRVDNDSSRPEAGSLKVTVEGGK